MKDTMKEKNRTLYKIITGRINLDCGFMGHTQGLGFQT